MMNNENIEIKPMLLTSKQASEYIGCKPQVLNQSRTNGELWGVPTPPYLKMARKVMYKKRDLDKWVDNLTYA